LPPGALGGEAPGDTVHIDSDERQQVLDMFNR
jgi:hypothetical protein